MRIWHVYPTELTCTLLILTAALRMELILTVINTHDEFKLIKLNLFSVHQCVTFNRLNMYFM